MIRAFVAIALPEDVRRRLETISRRLIKLNLDGRFVAGRSVHLTLKFLGSIEEGAVEEISEVMRESAEGISPFDLEVRSLGVFPHYAKPRIVWVGVECGEELPELRESMETRFEKLGFARERRRFHPHLTLIRLKSSKNWRELARFVEEQGAQQQAGVVSVRAIHLYQSTLRPDGAEYTQVATVKLTTDTTDNWPFLDTGRSSSVIRHSSMVIRDRHLNLKLGRPVAQIISCHKKGSRPFRACRGGRLQAPGQSSGRQESNSL